MPVLKSIGNVHVAVVDKRLVTSNRAQPICLIPLKTVKEDLTYLSESVNSQMLLDNLSGESICQLAVDHLMTVLDKLKSTPKVKLKVVFSSVKAVASPPPLQDQQDQHSSDSQETLLDETTDLAESPSYETTNQDVEPSAFEIALRRVLDEESQFLSNDTLVSVKKERECLEMTDQTAACLDSLAASDCFQSHSSTLQLGMATATEYKTRTLEHQGHKALLQTPTSMFGDIAKLDTSGSQFTGPSDSQTHTSDALVDPKLLQSHSPTLDLGLVTSPKAKAGIQEDQEEVFQTHVSYLQPMSDDVIISKTLGIHFTGPNCSQINISNLQSVSKDAAISEALRSPFTDPYPSKTHTSNLQPVSKYPARSENLGSEFTDPNQSQIYSSKLQPMFENASESRASRFIDVTYSRNPSPKRQPRSKGGTGAQISRSQLRVLKPKVPRTNPQALSQYAARPGTVGSEFTGASLLLIHPSYLKPTSGDAAGPGTISSQFGDPNHAHVRPSPLRPNVPPLMKNFHLEACKTSRGQVSSQQMDSIIVTRDTEPGAQEDYRKGAVKANNCTKSNFAFKSVHLESIPHSDLLQPVVSIPEDLIASNASETLTTNVTGGSETNREDRPARTENQIPFNIHLVDNSSEVPLENRCLIESNGLANVSNYKRLPAASTSQIKPGLDSTHKKLKPTRKKSLASHSQKKVVNTNAVKNIKRGERCRCIKCGHYSIRYQNLLKHTVRCHMKTVPCKCTDCGEEIRSAIAFQYHQLKHTEATQKEKDTLNRLAFTVRKMKADTTKKQTCKLCGKKVSSNLKAHLMIHSGEKPFHCDLCDWKFITKGALYAHMRKHSEHRRFACTFCQKTFKRNISLKQHILSHTAEKIYRCSICPKKFPQEDLLTEHLSEHESRGQGQPFCDICQKAFSNIAHLRRHMIIHSGKRPYKCEICGKSFVQDSNLSVHRRTHARQKERVCQKCGEQFKSRSTGQNHFCDACLVPSDNGLFTCNVCKKGFKTLASLKVHLQCHTSEKPYLCNICGKTFDRMAFYKHVQTKHPSHSTGKSLPCAVCGKVLKNKATLKIHLRCHSSERPYLCSICGKTFKQMGFYQHLRTHPSQSTGRSLSCGVCGKVFRNKAGLKSHERIHAK